MTDSYIRACYLHVPVTMSFIPNPHSAFEVYETWSIVLLTSLVRKWSAAPPSFLRNVIGPPILPRNKVVFSAATLGSATCLHQCGFEIA